MAKRTSSRGSKTEFELLEQANTIPEDDHPDFLGGTVSEESYPQPDEPAGETDVDELMQGSDRLSTELGARRLPMPETVPYKWPNPIFTPRFCGAVSGKYRYTAPLSRAYPQKSLASRLDSRPVVPQYIPGQIIPINTQIVTVRVDVDRYFPQNRISIEVTRLFPRRTAHAIAEVTSDKCWNFNVRTVRATIVYREGDQSLIPGTEVTFTARRGKGFNYSDYKLTLSGNFINTRTYELDFESSYFDSVEFEVDRVSNSGTIVTAYDTGTHPTRPNDLPEETVSLATVYQRAGFDVSMSSNTSVIPTSGTGSNGTWSDAEMHNAMVTYWSRFSNRPQWAMWVLYAARHDQGRSLGGIMFDDIGTNHRQGTAIFTDSFIVDAPPGDPSAAAWRNRMQFWTAVHEMGHAFNLAHAWQKAMGTPQGAPGDPWIPLANEPDSRSFMNYPFRVSGGQAAFFSDFRFRFSDDELIFMRHAPRRFVQMGNSNWFENHGFEAPEELRHTGTWRLALRPNRSASAYRFLEPVTMELKLTNNSNEAIAVDADMLSDGRHITVFVQREGGLIKQWRPMVTHCHETHGGRLGPGESIYGAHIVSTSTEGWLIDEPGFYKVQAAIDMTDEIVVSNVMRLYVGPPASSEESAVAPDYFTEDVGRVMTFSGAPSLADARATLKSVIDTCPDNPAAKHAEVAVSSPSLRNFKLLDADGGREGLAIRAMGAKVRTAARTQIAALMKDPDAAADTLGHIPYFAQLRAVAEAMDQDGDEKGAVKLMSKAIDVMKKRDILTSVIDNAERRLKRRS